MAKWKWGSHDVGARFGDLSDRDRVFFSALLLIRSQLWTCLVPFSALEFSSKMMESCQILFSFYS